MNRKLKALGRGLIAALALTAVMASAASGQFTSDRTHTILTGSQNANHEFSAGTGFGGITCGVAVFNGTSVNKSESTQVITPTYGSCKDSFNRTVDIDNSSLTYTFTSGAGKGTVHVSGGMTLTVTSGGSVVCTVVIKSPQTNSKVAYENLGGTSGVSVATSSTDVKSNTSGGFFNCGISNGDHTEGHYFSLSTITGVGTDKAAASISVD